MYRLAKLGFTQSYTYFTWRNTKWELTEYLTELTQTEVSEFFGPNLWPNTPDILPEYLQFGGRPAFVDAGGAGGDAGPSYGIYGPAFELCVSRAADAGQGGVSATRRSTRSRHWELDAEGQPAPSLIGPAQPDPAREPGLPQANHDLRFHQVDNPSS